ncbi:MAG: hypothetical protein H6592_03395 [Flavobacteriales bacterium]|nr:hypothetical protein [Flavobacteriales bacterium]
MSRYNQIKWPKYIAPARYAVRESSFWMNFSFFLTLELWFIQEMFIRDAYPEKDHNDLNHLMDMLGVIWGSFVTGYIFFWITVHLPEKRKQRMIDIDRERDVAMIVRGYFDLIVALIKGIPRDPDLKLSVFTRFYPSLEDQPLIYEQLVAIRPRTDGREWPWQPDDPFYMGFDQAFAIFKLRIDNLYDIRHTLDPWLYGIVMSAQEKSMRDVTNDLRDEEQRLDDLQVLNDVVVDFYQYGLRRMEKKKVCSSFFKDTYELHTFQDAWNEAAEEEMEAAEELKQWADDSVELDLSIPSNRDNDMTSPEATGNESKPEISSEQPSSGHNGKKKKKKKKKKKRT